MPLKVGEKILPFQVQKWVQGGPIDFEKEKGKTILIEVFQVNCPGCFLYGLPEAVRLFEEYKDKGLLVVGLATAFEDFDKNNLENLELLLKERKLIGAPLEVLKANNQLTEDEKFPYQISFPVAMDEIKEVQTAEGKVLIPQTFYSYGLLGTPSAIVVDKEGKVRHVSFGYDQNLEEIIKSLLFQK